LGGDRSRALVEGPRGGEALVAWFRKRVDEMLSVNLRKELD